MPLVALRTAFLSRVDAAIATLAADDLAGRTRTSVTGLIASMGTASELSLTWLPTGEEILVRYPAARVQLRAADCERSLPTVTLRMEDGAAGFARTWMAG
jgi:hypothetical protein